MYVIIGKEKYNVYDTVILHPTRFCITRVYKEANEREKKPHYYCLHQVKSIIVGQMPVLIYPMLHRRLPVHN